MDSLRHLLKKKVDFVSSPEHDGNPPTDEQLASFLRNLTTETGLALRGTPPGVREVVREKFAEAGWDVRSNTATRDEPPTVDELQAFLEGTIEALETFDPPVEPTEEELEDPALACQRLWDLDTNRLTPEDEYSINLQSGKKPYQEGDRASDPLFNYVKDCVFEKPTYSAFLKLLDNYTAAVGTGEVVTGEERQETVDFIEAIMSTPCMRYAHAYLVSKGQAPESETDFKNLLHQTWFAMYSRSRGSDDSSGFEHVFVGESKRGEITGLHNWIQMYSEEKSGRLDYMGYIFPRKRGYEDTPAETEQLVTVQFEWNGELKEISSSFVGVSPEFEIALYTLLFLLDQEKTIVDCGPYRVQVTTYIFREDGKKYIGSAFPGEG
ncbi:unnamed protein product [Ectocarpus sp. CCAP 1310/34]|nr:unnamed protein product [Ectocarpus sp. CCAP 1310/34]